jgi:hypothetical protein
MPGAQSKYIDEILAAEQAVASAMTAHSRGRDSVEAVNRANTRLANAHDGFYQCAAGIVPDHRGESK